MNSSLPEVAILVDLDRYPIHELTSARTRDLVSGWRREFEQTGACNFPGFVTADGVAELTAEAHALMPQAYYKEYTRNFLFEFEDDATRPADHPGHQFWTSSSLQLADDQFGPDSPLRQFYEWDALTAFVAAVQGKAKLHRFADEFQALNIIALGEGEQGIWHHDSNECTVTLLIQAPESGGEFVFGRDTLRPDGSVDLDEVSRLFATLPEQLPRLERGSGTLTLFRGGCSVHRVLPVHGPRKRISAILTYDPDPERVADDEDNCRIYGARVERVLAARRAGASAPSASAPAPG